MLKRERYIIVTTALFILLFSINVKANETDSISHRLNSMVLTDKASIKAYKEGLKKNKSFISLDTLFQFYEKGLVASKQIENDSLSWYFAASLAHKYFFQKDYAKSKKYTEIGLKYSQVLESPRYILNDYLRLGDIEMDQENYIKATDYFLLAAEQGKKIKNKNINTNAPYINMASCFLLLGEPKKAKENYKIAASQIVQFPDTILRNLYALSIIYHGIAECYLEVEEQDSARHYNEKILSIIEKMEECNLASDFERESYIVENYIAIFKRLYKLENFKEAKDIYEKIPKSNFSKITTENKYYADIIYLIMTNQLEEAELLLTALPTKVDTINYYENFFTLKAKFYEKKGDYKKSLDNYKAMYEDKFDRYKKQRIKLSEFTASKIARVEQENIIQSLEKEKNYRQKIAYLLIFLFGLTIYAYFQARKKSKYLTQNLESSKFIQKQAKELQKVEEQKNKLFTNVTHELQTPLSIIQGLGTELLDKLKLEKEDQQSLELIINNAQKLSTSTNQVLKRNSQPAKPEASKVDYFLLSAFIQFILPEYEILARKKNISIVIKNEDNLDVVICSNVKKLEVIIRNLLSNAIKYTPKGGAISLIYAEEAGFYQISVKDNGRGIPVEEQALIFNRYFQSNNDKPEGGFGLGLAICQEYINQLDGTISVFSQLGVGSTFTIEFPCKKQYEPSPTGLYTFSKKRHLEKRHLAVKESSLLVDTLAHLLIIEDNIDFCKYIETILKAEYRLSFAHDGAEALKYLEHIVPDIIITDWMMSGMDGFTLVQNLRRDAKNNRLPILMLSARNMPKDMIKALRVGVDDYLVKPFEKSNLKERINNLLHLKGDKKEVRFSFSLSRQKDLLPDLSTKDQDWLMKLETVTVPVMGDFNLNLEQIANLMEISPKQLNIKIKQLTKLTPKKYIQEMRYWEARRLLETKAVDSIKMLAFMVGFKDAKNFSRKFKERFDIYPSAYFKEEV